MKERSIDEKLKLLYGNNKGISGKVELQSTSHIPGQLTIEGLPAIDIYNSKDWLDENQLQAHIIKWLKKWYPAIHFRTDWFAGNFCPPWIKEQFSNAQSGDGFPDIEILKATKHYNGLHIETKLNPQKVFRQDGKTLLSAPHLQKQYEYILYLQQEGRCAVFGCGDLHIKQIVKDYINGLKITQDIVYNGKTESKYDKGLNSVADQFFKGQNII